MSTPKNKFLFLIPALIAFLVAAYMFLENRSLGFPDGHLTELDKAMRVVYGFSIPVLLFFCISFIFISVSPVFKRTLKILLICGFAILIVAVVILYFYFSANLDNGIGG